MEASRTHQVTHGQSLWSWVLIGAVGLTVAAAIVLAVQANSGGEYVTVRAPAEAQAEPQAQAQAEPSFRDDVLHGRGVVDVKVGATTFTAPATAIREGGVYAATAPIAPESFMQAREGYEAQEATVTPRRGLCATKQGC
jgi:hypothetical protein